MANAGYNHVVRIWSFIESPNDDDIGGARPSGTIVYDNVPARIQSLKPTQVLLEQGLELPRMFNIVVRPATMNIKHNQQVEFILPVNSKFYGLKFRIVGLQETSMHPSNSRDFILLTVKRTESALSNDYQ